MDRGLVLIQFEGLLELVQGIAEVWLWIEKFGQTQEMVAPPLAQFFRARQDKLEGCCIEGF